LQTLKFDTWRVSQSDVLYVEKGDEAPMPTQQAQTIKSARVGLRVPPDLKRAWDEAAELEERSLSDIIIAATTEAVAEIIDRHRIIRVSQTDMEQIMEDLRNPPEPNEALRSAARVVRFFGAVRIHY
jgi:uncharacterized protein (DUF1778 family)